MSSGTAKNRGKKHISQTDRASNLMKCADGKYPGYNVQGAIDGKYNMIADAIVTDHQMDRNLLQPVMESVKDNLDLEPWPLLTHPQPESFAGMMELWVYNMRRNLRRRREAKQKRQRGVDKE